MNIRSMIPSEQLVAVESTSSTPMPTPLSPSTFWIKQSLLLRSSLLGLNSGFTNGIGSQVNMIMPVVGARAFSFKTRKIAAKKLAGRRVKKYKLKTKKSL